MLTLTLTRTELSLADLVITSDPTAGSFHIAEDGVEWPRFPTIREYAPVSRILDGRVKLAASSDLGVMAATIYAHGATMAALWTAQEELEAATGQFTYNVTLTVDGVARTWAADPEAPSWGVVDTGMVRARLSRATITFTLHPGVI